MKNGILVILATIVVIGILWLWKIPAQQNCDCSAIEKIKVENQTLVLENQRINSMIVLHKQQRDSLMLLAKQANQKVIDFHKKGNEKVQAINRFNNDQLIEFFSNIKADSTDRD